MITKKIIDRRGFIKNLGLVSGGLVIGCHFTSCESDVKVLDDGKTFDPNVFIKLRKDGILELVCSRSEMGQGIRSSITSIIADEMEADWSKVKIIQASGDEKYGDQNTDGSRSIRYLFNVMRKMGATARELLIAAAAKKWEIDPSECYAENHYIKQKESNRKLQFEALVDIASLLPVPEEVSFKDSANYNFIGTHLPSKDLNDFISGKAVFGIDIRLPNMKFAAISRCPVTFGRVKSFDALEAKKFPGVLDVVEVPKINKPFGCLGGVAVIATNTWSALKGKEALKIQWDLGNNKNYNTESYLKLLKDRVSSKGKIILEEGNVDKVFKDKSHVSIESYFIAPHLVHAPMEVPNATADVKEGSCVIYAPTQDPQSAQKEIADYLELEQGNVVVNVPFLGGGFGRKSKSDFILEAVVLSKYLKNPVQVVWSREDDIKHSYYHANSVQYLKAALGANGELKGWLHRVAYPSIMSTFQPGTDMAANWEIGMGASNMPFDVANKRIENVKAEAYIRIGWMRSVYNIMNALSVNVFADELAIKAGKDALDFRLELIGKDRVENELDNEGKPNPYAFKSKRLKEVLIKAAKNANWGRELPVGHGLGLAVHYSFYSYVASVIEVSMIDDKVRVHKIWTVVDCGIAVNLDAITNQMEGSAIFGMSIALHSKITAKNGEIEQGNFDTYKLTRIAETPEIDVEIVKSEEASSGVGEPGVPVIAPAIINAIYAASGNRYRNIPLSDYGIT